MSSPIVTRFAPSPTGYLHIGGARTALFNWLYARHTGGTFLVRIEDTDRERSTQAAVDAIFEGLNWLGLTSDAPVIYQASRADRHREAVQQLLDTGRAYRCWMSADELESAREAARAASHALRSPWRDRTDGDASQPHVVRFRGPTDGETVVADLVLLRSDGAPTYNLAVVVDDHDMGVTHVIRGDDHLNNAARQSLIYSALDWAVPAFAHIPLIHGPDGAKLSKRHGAQAVGDFAELGYLPEALRNYLARLGWSHGDDEIFSDDQAIAWFDIADVNKGAARLDWDKLAFVNAHYIRAAADNRLAGLVDGVLQARDQAPTAEQKARIEAAMPLLKDRAKTLPELADQCAFLLKARPLTLDDKTRGLLTDETQGRLGRLLSQLENQADWDAATLEAALKAFAEAEGVGFGKIGPPLRGILTGGAPAPDLGKTLSALTKAESVGRIQDALSHRS